MTWANMTVVSDRPRGLLFGLDQVFGVAGA